MQKEIVINARFLAMRMAGTTRVAIEICRELLKRDLVLCFVSPKKLVHEDIAAEFKVKRKGFFNGFLWEQIELPFFLFRKKNPILINFNNSAPLLYGNSITALLDIIPIMKPEFASKKLYLQSFFTTRLIAKRSKGVFTISEYSKSDIVKKLHIRPEKVSVIYCGIKRLTSGRDRPAEVKPVEGKYILAVSSLEPRKNFINVVKAFNLLKEENLFLVLVGPNFQYHFDKLKPYINEQRTIIKGYVSDQELEELYKNAAAFVYPSLYEGFGLPPLEAMQYGCPVVTSNLTSIPEICGDAALYSDPYSPEDIAAKIQLLLTNQILRGEFVKKGLEKVKEYTWSRSAELLMDCINKVTA